MERTVAADDYKPVDVVFTKIFGCDFAIFFFFEFGAARGVQYRAAALYDVGNRTRVHLDYVVFE